MARKEKKEDFTPHEWKIRKDEFDRQIIREADYFTIFQFRGIGDRVTGQFSTLDEAMIAGQEKANEFLNKGVLVYAVRERDLARTPVLTLFGKKSE